MFRFFAPVAVGIILSLVVLAQPQQQQREPSVKNSSSVPSSNNERKSSPLKGDLYAHRSLPPQLFHQPFKMQPPAPAPGQDFLYTPNSSVMWALADLRTIPPPEQPYIRYLSLYNMPKNDRANMAKVISFLVNSLGRRKHMYIPSFVPNTDETLIRLNIKDYDWKSEAWEELATKGSGVRPFPEPYFHALLDKELLAPIEEVTVAAFEAGDVVETLTQADCFRLENNELFCRLVGRRQLEVIKVENEKIVVDTKYGRGYVLASQLKKIKGRTVKVDKPQESEKKGKVFAVAPWLDATSMSELITLTQSQSPIFRADWFLVNASVPPAYYNFLNLGKNIKDFDKLVFADENTSEKAHLQDKGIVIHSSVARNNRTLTRSSTLTGGYKWASHDTKKSVENRKYAQIVVDEEFDATEDIGTLPNGLQAYFVTNGKGERVDFADPDVAIDNTAVDRIVRTGRSCLICHSDGIRPIDDEIRKINEMLSNRESVRLLTKDDERARRVLDLFSSNLSVVVWKDQQKYQDAVNAAAGLDMRANAVKFSEFYDKYGEYLLSKEVAMREIGIPLPQLESIIRMSDDNVVLGMIKNPIRPIRRDQWEESFSRFMILSMSEQASKLWKPGTQAPATNVQLPPSIIRKAPEGPPAVVPAPK